MVIGEIRIAVKIAIIEEIGVTMRVTTVETVATRVGIVE
jgi:hypothetical protein